MGPDLDLAESQPASLFEHFDNVGVLERLDGRQAQAPAPLQLQLLEGTLDGR